MATSRSFSNMLNEYLPNSLLAEDMIKRNYFLQNVERDESWLGGKLIVPFKGASASTVKLGSLAAAADINQSITVRGEISSQPEVWGSLIFNERDLMEHGKISEQNLLKLLPDEIDSMMGFMSNVVGLSFANGHIVAKATANGDASGNLTVDRIERFEVGMPIQVEDDNTAALKVFVKQVKVDDNIIVCTTDMALSSLADLSVYTTAQNARVYFDGGETSANRFTSVKSALLSAANGGSSTLYGQSKLAYPYLQAINVSGSTITDSNILDKLFDAQTTVRNKGKGLPEKAIVSYKHLGSIMKSLNTQKGAYRQADETKVSQYGWTEIDVIGVKGKISIVAIQEKDDDSIFILDMKALKVYSNGFFKKRKAPDGKEYFEVRNTSGYQYIVDVCFFGDLVLERPSRCGIIYGISY